MKETPKTDGTLAKIERAPISGDRRGLNPESIDEMFRVATLVVNSGEFKDINTPAQAMIRMQAGMELGLGWLWSLVNVMVVNGRPAVWGDALPGILKARLDCEDIIESDPGQLAKDGENAVARCEVLRVGKHPVVRTYSVNDAKRAGLWKKIGPWQTNPYRQLQMRARGFACRDAFPDALRGLGVIEELRDVEPRQQVESKPKPEIVLPDESHERDSSYSSGNSLSIRQSDEDERRKAQNQQANELELA